MLKHLKKKALNPYNRNVIQPVVYENVKGIVNLSKILGLDTNIEVKNDFDLLSLKKGRTKVCKYISKNR